MSETNPQTNGDHIEVGEIQNALAVAIGAGATAVYQGLTVEEVAALVFELKNKDQPTVWNGRIPYLGLSAYQEADARYFFGRESLVDELLQRVQEANFITIAGPSGSGKSSVARAGLFHALRQGVEIKNSDRWLLATMQPAGDPFGQLARAIEKATKSPAVGEALQPQDKNYPTGETLLRHITMYLENEDDRCILLIDQFEELFTQTKSAEQRQSFIDLLTHASQAVESPLTVIISLRSDFVSNCASHENLLKLISQQFQLVGAMASQDLAKAIALPAVEVGAEIDPGLVSKIMADMKGSPDALPLMSFTLRDLFEAEKTKIGEPMDLTLPEYVQRGGLENALEEHADKVLRNFTSEEQKIVRKIFSKLIQVRQGQKATDTRRTAAFTELIPVNDNTEEVVAVLDQLVANRLVTIDRNLDEQDPIVFIAHEKMIDAWPWLRALINENRELIFLLNRLNADAQSWQKEQDDEFLYRGRHLAEIEEKLDDLRSELSILSLRFVEASLERKKRDKLRVRQEREERLRLKELNQALIESAKQNKEKKPLLIVELEKAHDIDLIEFSTPPPDIAQGYSLNKENEIVSLSIGHAELDEVPLQILQMSSLKTLSLFNNNISNIPIEICNLTHLSYLNLMCNELRQLPEEIGNLQKLSKLNVAQNGLTQIPHTLASIKTLNELLLDGNPLQQPPVELVQQGIGAVFEYLRNVPQNSKEINEAKIILVGNGEAGKTTLVRRLIYDKFNPPKRTPGIEINRWITAISEGDFVEYRIWDFGGQEIYRSTHQFFLTKRSVYLLVWNARKSRDYDHIYRWLYLVDAYSKNSPIIIVMTKADEIEDDINLRDIKEKFPQVVDHVKVDSKSGTGIENLRKQIKSVSENQLQVKTTWISSWLKVRQRLEAENRSWIGYFEFESICDQEGLNKEETEILGEYLHDLGIIIHYQEAKLGLQSIIILNPKWATDAVYKFLDSYELRQTKGLLNYTELPNILDSSEFPSSVHAMILALMRKFEMAFEISEENSFLIPAHLPSKEVEHTWDNQDNLIFSYLYGILPPGLLPRFISKVHRYLELNENNSPICWADGAVIDWESTRAKINVNRLNRTIVIRISGRFKRELLAILRIQIDRINDSLKRLKIAKKIPCKCSPDCPYEFDYEKLLKAEEKGVPSVQCQESWDSIAVELLLEGYITKTVDSPNESPSVFIDLHGNYIAGDNITARDIKGSGIAIGRKSHSKTGHQ